MKIQHHKPPFLECTVFFLLKGFIAFKTGDIASELKI